MKQFSRNTPFPVFGESRFFNKKKTKLPILSAEPRVRAYARNHNTFKSSPEFVKNFLQMGGKIYKCVTKSCGDRYKRVI